MLNPLASGSIAGTRLVSWMRPRAVSFSSPLKPAFFEIVSRGKSITAAPAHCGVGVADGVMLVGVRVGVGVSVWVGVCVGVGVRVAVRAGVEVAVLVAVVVGVPVTVGVGVTVRVGHGVGVGPVE